MPSFKGIERGRSITGAGTGAKISPGVGAQLGQAIKDVGRGLEDIMAVAERNKIQDRNNKLGILKKSYDDLRRPYFTEESNLTGSDTYGNVERVDENSKKWLTELTKDIDDPELIAGLNAYSDVETGNMKDRLAQYQATQRGEVNRQVREESLDGILRDSRDGFDLFSNSITKIQDVAADQRELGMMGEEEAVDFIVSSQQVIAEAHLEGIMDRNPVRAIELIERGIYEDYLSPKQIKAADKKAKTMQNALDADAKAAKVEAERLAKVQKEEQRQEANKGLTDLFSAGILSDSAIEEKRKILNDDDYDRWKLRQKESVKNKSKATGKVVEDIEKKLALEVKARKMGPETTDGELNEFSLEMALLQEEEKLTSDSATKIEAIATKSQEVGPLTKKIQAGILVNLKSDFEGGLFGTEKEASIEHLKQQQYFLQWSAENPDKSLTDEYERISDVNKKGFIEGLLDIGKRIGTGRVPEIKAETMQEQREVAEKRQAAIKILGKRPVTEKNIKFIMEQL